MIDEKTMVFINNLMNDDIRELVHRELSPCTYEEFLRRYCELDTGFEDILKIEFSIEL